MDSRKILTSRQSRKPLCSANLSLHLLQPVRERQDIVISVRPWSTHEDPGRGLPIIYGFCKGAKGGVLQ